MPVPKRQPNAGMHLSPCKWRSSIMSQLLWKMQGRPGYDSWEFPCGGPLLPMGIAKRLTRRGSAT